MKKHNKNMISYWAGLFDGEGCVMISKGRNDRANPCYVLRVSLHNTNKYIIYLLRFYFGYGCVSFALRSKEAKRRDIYSWGVANRQAYEFLKLIEPYVIIKKAEVAIALKFQEQVQEQSQYTKKTFSTKLTDETLAVREAQRIALQQLKRLPVEPPSLTA